MKRMSEVFELPVRAVGVEWLTMQSSDDTDEAIAKAINHIDALADALQKLLDDACDNGMHNRASVYAAGKALAAYRGSK